MKVSSFFSQMTCYHKITSFGGAVDSSAIDTPIVIDGNGFDKCANQLLCVSFICEFQILKNEDFWNSVTATDNETFDDSRLQEFISRFNADATEHHTHLFDIYNIGILIE